ncbi:MAG TPA: glycosyltransferase, partial [Blastocatellia bacterium]|nr:glycosyltransferase [Blastocatellia bacterium]
LSNPKKTLGFQEFTQSQPKVWEQIKSWCTSFQMIETLHEDTGRAPVKNFVRALQDPVQYTCPDAHPRVLSTLKSVVAQIRPEMIWAEHRIPAMLAQLAVPHVPIIYSFHDWEWRLGLLRHESRSNAMSGLKKLRSRFGVWQTRRAEHVTVSSVAACVSGSVTETAEFQTIGAQRVAYFPTTYQPVDLRDVADATEPIRVVHLGAMQGTRNLISVQRFLDLSWFPSCINHQAKPELWMVGSMKHAPDDFMVELKRAEAHCTGFVQDLSTVLRPGDVHVVPWELPTGTRTRIPVALNHGQALVSTKAAAICLPELKHNENCLLVDDLSEMGVAIAELLNEPKRRKRIAQAGRDTFLKHFTRDSVQPRFERFVEDLKLSRAASIY